MTASSDTKKVFRIGMLGFGTVGAGTAQIVLHSRPSLKEKTGIDIQIRRIAVRDMKKHRAVSIDPALFTSDGQAVVDDPEIDIVVEVIGGIEPARTLILRALKNGKAVVTANKALLATHGKELFETALAHGGSIGFEASVCGGIPVIGALRDGLVANRIESIHGILNGTTNYILTRMVEDKVSYAQCLYEAQSKGYAEADPSTDVKGIDAAHKLTLLSNLAFHSIFDFSEVHAEGIDGLALDDVRYASDLGYAVKLLAVAKRRNPGADPEDFPGGLELRVHPALVPFSHPLANVRDVNNAVLIRGDATGEVMLYGRGAGMMPTGSAIVADIMDAARGSARQTFTKLQFFQNPREDMPVIPTDKIRSRYYVRFNVDDRPGVMGKVATVLGGHGVSIASVIQKEPHETGFVPIVMLTHLSVEDRFQAARAEIESLPFVRKPSAFYRVED
ncbi:MAG: homoserine dehydrogenase [Planctomycetes bacterium]|nr:homoserine dehydrogenase [Planctomycetota bacterium]